MDIITKKQGLEISRRQLIKGLGASALLMALPSEAWAMLTQHTRALSFDHLHTGEKLTITYWADGKYIPGAVEEISHLLRDHRNQKVHAIDTTLLDKLVLIRNRLNTEQPFQVICGYRSPESNAMMHARSKGVAKKSLHMEGKAIDIRVPGRDLKTLQQAALDLNNGGVGYYPKSQFVHVDTGKTRRW